MNSFVRTFLLFDSKIEKKNEKEREGESKIVPAIKNQIINEIFANLHSLSNKFRIY